MSGEAPPTAAPAAAPSTSDAAGAPSTGAAAETTPARSTADIAANVIERTENPPEAEDETPPTPAEVARFTDEEKMLRDAGFKRAKKADGTEHFIPRSKVLQIIANARRRDREQSQTVEQEVAQLRQFRDGFASHLSGPEEQFLAYISQHDPRYARFLARQEAPPANGNGHGQHPAQTDEPQPDLDLGNGQATFSLQGMQRWLDWAVEQRLDQRLAPVEQEREQARRQAQLEQVREQRRQEVRGQIAAATQWPSWGDYEGDVLKKLQDDTAAATRAGQRPKMSLREAYLEVKAERLEASQDPTKVRQQVIADINAAPRSTATRVGSEVPRQATTRTTADIARAIIERSERGR